MGQGQEVHARRLVGTSMSEGQWVLLQNCHLGLDYMDELLDVVSCSGKRTKIFLIGRVHFHICLSQFKYKLDLRFKFQITTQEQMHDGFRCWITTEPHPKFPINLLQSSIKYTAEPPQGVKAGLKRTYGLITQVSTMISKVVDQI